MLKVCPLQLVSAEIQGPNAGLGSFTKGALRLDGWRLRLVLGIHDTSPML
jgi:hypothetical protein